MSHILKILKELSLRLKEKLEADGITIITNNYYGQEIKHLHFHIIPRYEGDKFDDLFNHKEMDLEKVYRQIM